MSWRRAITNHKYRVGFIKILDSLLLSVSVSVCLFQILCYPTSFVSNPVLYICALHPFLFVLSATLCFAFTVYDLPWDSTAISISGTVVITSSSYMCVFSLVEKVQYMYIIVVWKSKFISILQFQSINTPYNQLLKIFIKIGGPVFIQQTGVCFVYKNRTTCLCFENVHQNRWSCFYTANWCLFCKGFCAV